MRKVFLVIGLLSGQMLSGVSHAQEAAPPVTPTEARQTWDSLTPAQQEAAKQYAKQQAQDKAAAHQQLSPAQKQQKRADFTAKFRTRRAAR